MTSTEYRSGCVVRGQDGHAWPVPARVDQDDLYVDVSLQRDVLMGTTNEGVVAFAEFSDDEAHLEAVRVEAEKHGDPEDKTSRLLGAIFGKSIAPRLKIEILVMDGVEVYEVDLKPIMPGYVLIVPCRLVPNSD